MGALLFMFQNLNIATVLFPNSLVVVPQEARRRGGRAVGGSGCMRGQQNHRHAEGGRERAQKTRAVHENHDTRDS